MDFDQYNFDHRNNEFYSFRYSSRFQKGEIVEVRIGNDLEAARFQGKKNFPDVLNEYWWLKPSDIPILKEIPLKVNDIFYYTGGIPILVMVSANGSLFRKAQIFMRKKDEGKTIISSDLQLKIELLEPENLSKLLLSADLNVRRMAHSVLNERHADFIHREIEPEIVHHIFSDNYEALKAIGEPALELLLERFFTTARPKEPERILETIISMGCTAIAKLEDTVEYLSENASPFYAKRLNWTINEIKKGQKKRK